MDHRLQALTAAATAALALAVPATAAGHSIVRAGGGELTSLSADATSLNTLTARLSNGRIELRDPTVDGGMDPGPCEPGDVDASGFVVQVFCAREGLKLLRIDAGDREDTVSAAGLPLSVVLLGGEGADRLTAGPADDTVAGDAGDDTLAGAGGADTLTGGLGTDEVDAGAGGDEVNVRDGLADRIRCGDGTDEVSADTLDEVAGDCEVVSREATVPPEGDAGSGDRAAPRVEAGASTRQRLGRRPAIRIAATSSERGTIAASGVLDVAGVGLPLRSRRARVVVAGGGVELKIRLSGSQARRVRRALRRGRRVTARLEVVATDAAGNSASTRAPRIRLLG